MATPQKLLTRCEAAERLNLSPKTLDNWRSTQAAALPYVKLGGRIRYLESDIQRFIDRSRVDAPAGQR